MKYIGMTKFNSLERKRLLITLLLREWARKMNECREQNKILFRESSEKLFVL